MIIFNIAIFIDQLLIAFWENSRLLAVHCFSLHIERTNGFAQICFTQICLEKIKQTEEEIWGKPTYLCPLF